MSLGPDAPDDVYNADGTFAFPPYPRSAAQHLAFWERVQVPDEVLVRVHNEYDNQRNQWYEQQMAEWDQTNPKPKTGIGRRDAADGWEVERQRYSDEVAAVRPPLNRAAIRPLVRMAQAYYYSSLLPEDEQQRVIDHPLPWVAGVETTPREVVERFDLARLQDVMIPTTGADEIAALADVSRRIDALHNEVHRNWDWDRRGL